MNDATAHDLIDSSVLVGVVDRSDFDHERCIAAVESVNDTVLLTSWPCLTESMYLIEQSGGFRFQAILWELVWSKKLLLHPLSELETRDTSELMERYQNLPMDVADATLVAIANSLGIRQIFTLDEHFRVYRLKDGSVLEIMP